MSAIGEYVHLTAENYIKYGVRRKSQGNKTAAAVDMMNMKRNQIRQKVAQRVKRGNIEGAKKLEDKLNNFLDYIDRVDDNDLSGQNKMIIQDTIIEMLQKQFGETLGKINMAQANVEATVQSGKIGAIKSPYHYSSRGDSYQKTVVERIKKLKDSIKKVQTELGQLPAKKDGTGGRTAEQIAKDLDYIESLLKNTKKQITDKLTKDSNIVKGMSLSGDEKNLIADINELITIYANVQPVADQKGMLFEMLTSLVPYQFLQIGQKYSEEAFKQGIQEAKKALAKNQLGKNLATVRYGIEFFQSGMFEKGATGPKDDAATIQLKNILEKVSTSEQKIDVAIEVEGTDPEMQGMTISAKDYALGETWNKGRISVSTQNSLLHFLQDENDNDFVNHWLNVVAGHEKDGHKSAPYQAKINAMRPQYNNAIKYIVLYKALTGDAYGRGGPNAIPEFLVINNNKAGVGQQHVKIIPLQDLLFKALENFDKNNRRQGFFVELSPNLFNGNTFLENDRVPETKENKEYVRWGTTRIAKLLVNLHQVKIHAGVNVSLVNLAHMSAMQL